MIFVAEGRVRGEMRWGMTLDDHEIEDNWSEQASTKDWTTLYPVAMHAYLTYQASHSPLLEASRGSLSGVPNRLWYGSHRDRRRFALMDSGRT